MILVIS